MNIFNKKLIHLKQQKLDIGSSEKLFSSLFNKKITVSISNVKDNLFSIGRVKSVQNSEILFETISTNAKWWVSRKSWGAS